MITGGTISAVGDAIDSLVTSDEERLQLKNKLLEIETNSKIRNKELDNEYQKQITNRWSSDNKEGNFLTRSVRPLTLIYLLGVITVFALFDGNVGDFEIADSYIELFKTLAVVTFTAFFGSKGIEIYKHGRVL